MSRSKRGAERTKELANRELQGELNRVRTQLKRMEMEKFAAVTLLLKLQAALDLAVKQTAKLNLEIKEKEIFPIDAEIQIKKINPFIQYATKPPKDERIEEKSTSTLPRPTPTPVTTAPAPPKKGGLILPSQKEKPHAT